jgi:hypothetical protein
MSTNPEEYHADEETESPETGTAYNPSTGEAETTPHDRELIETDPESGNPNAGTSAGLEGDMGISSERTGPADETGTEGLGDLTGLEGTGTVGSAASRTHGTVATDVHGPEMDDTQQEATQAWMDQQPEAGDTETPKRTVGESNRAEVPPHRLGNKNPGHSGGTPGQSG